MNAVEQFEEAFQKLQDQRAAGIAPEMREEDLRRIEHENRKVESWRRELVPDEPPSDPNQG